MAIRRVLAPGLRDRADRMTVTAWLGSRFRPRQEQASLATPVAMLSREIAKVRHLAVLIRIADPGVSPSSSIRHVFLM
jgi:hypothetical protein